MQTTEKQAALMAKAERMRQAVEDVQRQFDACPMQEKEYRIATQELYLPMSDGVKLYTLLYRPEGLPQIPVLVQRSCYPDQMDLYRVYGQELARRGYGYLVQICRGTGPSQGVWEPNVHERQDGYDTLQWLDAQPWVESIGYFGASYLALTGWAVADILPPKVKGMMLTVYGTDRFTSAYEKGLFRHDVLTGWAMPNAGRPIDADYLESCRYRPHAEVDTALWGGRLPWYQDWIHAANREDPYWQQGWWKQLREIPGRTHVPVYIVDAWYDHHFGSAIRAYHALAPETKAHSWLDIGCWNHMSQPCIEWGSQQHLENGDVRRILTWFDLLLKEKKLPKARVRAYVMREDTWKELPAWPAQVQTVQTFFLSEQGRLTSQPEVGVCRFVYDPEDPCPTHGAESVLTTIAEAGSLLQPQPGYRPDVVSFVSEPLARPLPVCGQIRVRLRVSTDGGDTAFTAKLMEVFPDGRAYNIRGGITTIQADMPEGHTYAAGEIADVQVEMWDMAWTLQPGSCLRLDVSSSDFPQYAIHSNYAGLWSEQKQTRVAQQTLWLGEGCAIELPLAGPADG